MMDRRSFLRACSLVAAGVIAADQLEILDRLAPRSLFAGWRPPVVGGREIRLVDWAKRLDPNGEVARVVELLNASNELLLDYPLTALPRSSSRGGSPIIQWRPLA